MIRTALTLSISTQDAQNNSYLVNGTHLGLLSSASQNIHVQTSHRPLQLIAALHAEDAASGAAIAHQRQVISAWQDFLQLLAHHQSSDLNSLLQKYRLQPDWLICLDEHRLQAWLTTDAGFYLLRGNELRRLRPIAPRESALTAAAADGRTEVKSDSRQYYALNIFATDHFFLLPPSLLSFFSAGEAAGILLGLRQLPAKMSDLFNTARLRGFTDDCTWLAMQILRQEDDQLPDMDHGGNWRKALSGLFAKAKVREAADSGSDSLSLHETGDENDEAASTPGIPFRPDRRLMIVLGGLLTLAAIFLLLHFLLPAGDEPKATTTETTTVQITSVTTVTPSPEPTAAPVETTIALPQLAVSASKLNLREQADRNSNLLATLKAGDVLYKLAEPEGDWVKVQTMDGIIGYVYANYVADATN